MSETKKSLKVIGFEAENVRVLKRVKIEPDGNVTVIAGDNGAGKSTVLETIMLTLGGGTMPEQPVRRGEAKGRCELKLGPAFGQPPTVRVHRVWDSRGTRLEVDGLDGSPQSALRRLYSAVAFRPLEFAEEKDPKKQAETLRKLVGVDFSADDSKRAGIYADRERSGQTLRQLEGELAGYPAAPAGTPETEVSIKDLLAEKSAAESINVAADRLQLKYTDAATAAARAGEARKKAAENFERAKAVLAAADTAWGASMEDKVEAKDAAESAKRVYVAPIDGKLANAETINRAVRTEQQRRQVAAEVEKMRAEREAFTAAIKAIDEAKAAKLTGIKWPIEGLGFGESGVTFNGLPYAQASRAERYRVSVAIGAAISGDLRVMLIEDASLLDKKSMAMLAEIAEEYDMGMWIERVGEGDKGAIVLVDGEVSKSSDAASAAKAGA